jgi:hypothetical protein
VRVGKRPVFLISGSEINTELTELCEDNWPWSGKYSFSDFIYGSKIFLFAAGQENLRRRRKDRTRGRDLALLWIPKAKRQESVRIVDLKKTVCYRLQNRPTIVDL